MPKSRVRKHKNSTNNYYTQTIIDKRKKIEKIEVSENGRETIVVLVDNPNYLKVKKIQHYGK